MVSLTGKQRFDCERQTEHGNWHSCMQRYHAWIEAPFDGSGCELEMSSGICAGKVVQALNPFSAICTEG